jgi:regulator of protease activity HflC (stomatin/prohibitin superfamily)
MVELAPGDVTNRGKIEPLIQRKLEESLVAKYGAGTVLVNKVTVGDMDFEAAYNKAIQAKSIASQEQAKTAIENQTAIEKAEAGKQVAVLKAEAKAEQVRIAAEAEADANRMIQESLTDSLIRKHRKAYFSFSTSFSLAVTRLAS